MEVDFSEIILSKNNISQFLGQSQSSYIVRFWAPWCESCRVNEEVVSRVLKRTHGVCKAYKVNIDREPELANSMNVQYLPEMIVIDKHGGENRLTGEVDEKILITLLE